MPRLAQGFAVQQILFIKLDFRQVVRSALHFHPAGRARGVPAAVVVEREPQLLRGIEQLSQVFQDADSRTHLAEATAAVADSRFYQAMKALRALLPREARLLGLARPA